MKNNNSQQGVSLYIAIMIMTISLAMILGLSLIFLKQTRIARGVGNSVVAFYAADTGIERLLYQDEQCRQTPNCTSTLPWPCQDGCEGMATSTETGSLSNGASYIIKFTMPDPQNVMESSGTFRDIRRAIQVSR